MEKKGQVVLIEKRKWNPVSPKERRYKGIRIRKWGKWVLPDRNAVVSVGGDMSAAFIRQKAEEVGARVDAELRTESSIS
ncbi:hypothetical protein HID58_087172 [Brassica napus]|uniref:Uncharacterized protein n=1 Tax=Brassica napus TaxID=3708 RepID=A0ABQ7XV35_BRANA|nr:PREDICTED: ethylene-responsive transcription factor RAP2-9 [Brassica oleracea var. oleracea]XP_013713650.1 ethylene-responsive transcription factor RAP2-9-like [Brassica napus]KAH0858911.1 hypothetical protein HID58_087172 [Brassica napus]